jgi:hypothetical protein
MVYKINTAEEVYGPQVLEPRQHRKKQEVRPATSGDNPKEICVSGDLSGARRKPKDSRKQLERIQEDRSR